MTVATQSVVMTTISPGMLGPTCLATIRSGPWPTATDASTHGSFRTAGVQARAGRRKRAKARPRWR